MTFWKELRWIHASLLSCPLVKVEMAIGQRLGRLDASCVMWDLLSIQAGHGQTWASSSGGCLWVPRGPLEVKGFSAHGKGDWRAVHWGVWLMPTSPYCRCVWGCACVGEEQPAVHKGFSHPGKHHVMRVSGCTWNKGVRVTFLKLEYV